MMAVFKKDLLVLMVSPLAGICAALFLFLTAFAFNAQLTVATPEQLPEASMRGLIYFMAVVLLFMTPLLTMRSFAEECRLKTMESLRTAPIGDGALVFAKFSAVWVFLTLLLFSSFVFPLIMLIFAKPDLGPLFLSYLGLWLLCGAYAGFGVLMSSVSQSPILAGLLGLVGLLLLWFVGGIQAEWAAELSVIRHLESFSMGVLDISDLLYYGLFIVACLFLTWRWQEASRWR